MMEFDDDTLTKELKRADNVVLCTGFDSDTEGEGFDRPLLFLNIKWNLSGVSQHSIPELP